MIDVDATSSSYIELLRRASEADDSSIVFTIPPGFEDVDQDKDFLKRQEALQQFEQLVRDIRIAARD